MLLINVCTVCFFVGATASVNLDNKSIFNKKRSPDALTLKLSSRHLIAMCLVRTLLLPQSLNNEIAISEQILSAHFIVKIGF